jgi:two-component sensor histidine kinase
MSADRPIPAPALTDPEDYAPGANEIHEQIIGSFCHDLRQPLNAALMRLASLKRAYTTGQDRELLEELHLNLREIASMSETVFDAIRLSRASIRPNPGAVSIQDLFERVRSEFGPLAEQRGLRLVIKPAPLLVVTDEILLARVLWNLVQNALNYTREGGVLVAARRAAGAFSLEVWDTGPGIAKEQIEKIFTPFFRGGHDAKGRQSTRNSGIGLWNGREFARLLGGTLSVASRPGRGSVFRLRLPVPMEILKPRASLARRTARGARALIALLVSEPAQLIEHQRLVLAHGESHVSFADPLELLAYLNVPLNRPDALLIELRSGPVNAEFLVGIVAARYPDLPVAVVIDAQDERGVAQLTRLHARILRRPVAGTDLDALFQDSRAEDHAVAECMGELGRELVDNASRVRRARKAAKRKPAVPVHPLA